MNLIILENSSIFLELVKFSTEYGYGCFKFVKCYSYRPTLVRWLRVFLRLFLSWQNAHNFTVFCGTLIQVSALWYFVFIFWHGSVFFLLNLLSRSKFNIWIVAYSIWKSQFDFYDIFLLIITLTQQNIYESEISSCNTQIIQNLTGVEYVIIVFKKWQIYCCIPLKVVYTKCAISACI